MQNAKCKMQNWGTGKGNRSHSDEYFFRGRNPLGFDPQRNTIKKAFAQAKGFIHFAFCILHFAFPPLLFAPSVFKKFDIPHERKETS